MALEYQEKSKVIILDDYIARKVAVSLNLEVTGTAGVLLLALKRKIISLVEFKKIFRRLCETTAYRISVEIYNEVLDEANRYADK
ncbi:MAG: DUF3368 domain-containing protein [Promethearchaeota archaeon]